MSTVDVLLSLVVLLPMGALGVAVLWRARLGLDPLECVAYGISVGWAGCSLIQLGLAIVFGLTPLLVIASALVFTAAVLIIGPAPAEPGRPPVVPVRTPVDQAGDRWSLGVAGGWPARVRSSLDRLGAWRPLGWANASWSDAIPLLQRVSWLPTIVLVLMAIPWTRFWFTAVDYGPDGLSFGHIFLYYDWPLHLGDVASILYGHNLPMENPRYAGSSYPYHYLSSFTAALIAALGVEPGYAMALHSFFATFGVALAIYAFARRLLLAGMPIFVIANVVAFQPFASDNVKLWLER